MKISNRIEEINVEDVARDIFISCIYMVRNLNNGKIYVGRSADAVHRAVGHYYCLRSGKHNSEEMQMDFNAGDEFEIKALCSFDKQDRDRQIKALETFFILQYDSVREGYNKTYNYPTINRAYEIIQMHAEYIIQHLKNNGISFRLQLLL